MKLLCVLLLTVMVLHGADSAAFSPSKQMISFFDALSARDCDSLASKFAPGGTVRLSMPGIGQNWWVYNQTNSAFFCKMQFVTFVPNAEVTVDYGLSFTMTANIALTVLHPNTESPCLITYFSAGQGFIDENGLIVNGTFAMNIEDFTSHMARCLLPPTAEVTTPFERPQYKDSPLVQKALALLDNLWFFQCEDFQRGLAANFQYEIIYGSGMFYNSTVMYGICAGMRAARGSYGVQYFQPINAVQTVTNRVILSGFGAFAVFDPVNKIPCSVLHRGSLLVAFDQNQLITEIQNSEDPRVLMSELETKCHWKPNPPPTR